MPYELMIEDHFDAAHHLRRYVGKCANQHGHSWRAQVFVSGNSLNEIGLLIDFKDIKSTLKSILDAFDHHDLNDIFPFAEFNPTAENLSFVIFDRLCRKLPEGIKLIKVTVWESPNACCSYWEDELES